MNRRYLLFTVFIAGMCTLALEFTASRLVQTVYGTSNIVWANVIGLTLFSLMLGYFIGGRWADRNPSAQTFYQLITAAGATSIVLLLLTSMVLRSAASALSALNIGAVAGSLVFVIVAIGLPVVLLGCVSPFAIRLGVRDVSEAGRISGQIYALSTAGSLLGTYLPALVTIPLAGTRLTALIFGCLLLATGLVGWRFSTDKLPIPLLIALLGGVGAVALLTAGNVKNTPNQIAEAESAYNYLQVVREDGCNVLYINEGVGQHSLTCDDGSVRPNTTWWMMVVAPLYSGNPSPKNMAIVGLAGGTIAQLYTEAFGDIAIDGIELDPEIVRLGREFFVLDAPNLNVIVGDGRYELNRLSETYDVIALDAYRVPYIPWHLTTQEYFGEVRARLAADGVLVINAGRVPNDRRLVEALTATLLTVFPAVHTIDIEGSLNSILIATNRPSDGTQMRAAENAPPLLHEVAAAARAGQVPTVGSQMVFSDDHAPVETLVDSLVLRYLWDEGLTIFGN